jgi:prepilin-type processing-associated H-X9-DG protein
MDMHHIGTTAEKILDPYAANMAFANQSQTPNHRGPNHDTLTECPEEGLASAQLENMPCGRWIGVNASEMSHVVGWLGWQSAAPRSLHPGGVMSAYLDGHFEFLADDVEPLRMSFTISVRDDAVYVPPANVATN